MRIINSAGSKEAAPFNITELGNSMERVNKYMDSNLLKYFPQSYDANTVSVTSAVKNAVSISTEATPLRKIDGQTSPVQTPGPLEQYRLQLYNYALNIDRLRCTQHNTSTYASSPVSGLHLFINGENNRNFGSIDLKMASNYGCPSINSVRPYVPVALAHGNRLDLSMSLFPQRMFRSEEPKPQYSYIGLIAMAILSSTETKLVLSDIYQHILDNYPYFRARGPGWRNSIRHNLSLNDCFIKSGRSANGKGHYWAIHPANIDDFRRGDFRRRKAQRKVRKHMGLSLDDAGIDSPSPPPLDLTSTELTSTRLLRLAQQGNSLTAMHDFHTPNALSFSCLHPLLQMPASSFSLQQAQQQIQDSYFGTAIMEQYTCMPSLPAYSSGYSTSLQQEYYKLYSNGHVDNIQTNDNITPLCNEQTLNDTHKNAKLSLFNGTAITTVAPHAISDAKTNYYTQIHKRQFDVASLLAPDRKLFTTTLKEMGGQQAPSFETLEHTQILQKNIEEQGKQHHEAQPTHSTHKSLLTIPLPQTHKFSPLELEYECEQEQDEIDVVANDIDEDSKESFTHAANKNNDEQQQVFGAVTKNGCRTNNGIQIYDADSEHSALHRSANAIHHHAKLPSAVIEWRMVQQQPLSVEKLIKKFGAGNVCNATNNTIGFEDCYAAKITTSASTVSPTINSKSLEDTSETNLSNCKNQIEHEPNAITINAAAHKSLHVRRIIQHLHQQQQQQSQETLKESVDDKDCRHYSTYISATTSRQIGPMQLKQIQCQQQKCDILSKRR